MWSVSLSLSLALSLSLSQEQKAAEQKARLEREAAARAVLEEALSAGGIPELDLPPEKPLEYLQRLHEGN